MKHDETSAERLKTCFKLWKMNFLLLLISFTLPSIATSGLEPSLTVREDKMLNFTCDMPPVENFKRLLGINISFSPEKTPERTLVLATLFGMNPPKVADDQFARATAPKESERNQPSNWYLNLVTPLSQSGTYNCTISYYHTNRDDCKKPDIYATITMSVKLDMTGNMFLIKADNPSRYKATIDDVHQVSVTWRKRESTSRDNVKVKRTPISDAFTNDYATEWVSFFEGSLNPNDTERVVMWCSTFGQKTNVCKKPYVSDSMLGNNTVVFYLRQSKCRQNYNYSCEVFDVRDIGSSYQVLIQNEISLKQTTPTNIFQSKPDIINNQSHFVWAVSVTVILAILIVLFPLVVVVIVKNRNTPEKSPSGMNDAEDLKLNERGRLTQTYP